MGSFHRQTLLTSATALADVVPIFPYSTYQILEEMKNKGKVKDCA